MAVYRLSVTTIKRSEGRSAIAAAAYRAGDKLRDEQLGRTHNYQNRKGVVHSEMVLPRAAPDWAKSTSREQLWNLVEARETRKNSVVAREFQISLPHEMTDDQRKELTLQLAQGIAEKHSVAVDVAIHAPKHLAPADVEAAKAIDPEHPDPRIDQGKNHHAHLLLTTRRLVYDTEREPDDPRRYLGDKTRELDVHAQKQVPYWREQFCAMQNAALDRAGIDAQVSHLSLADQGIEHEPQSLSLVVHSMEDPDKQKAQNGTAIKTDIGEAIRKQQRPQPQVDIDNKSEDELAAEPDKKEPAIVQQRPQLQIDIDSKNNDELTAELETYKKDDPHVKAHDYYQAIIEELESDVDDALAAEAYAMDDTDKAKAAVEQWEEAHRIRTVVHRKLGITNKQLTALDEAKGAANENEKNVRALRKHAQLKVADQVKERTSVEQQLAEHYWSNLKHRQAELELRASERQVYSLMQEKFIQDRPLEFGSHKPRVPDATGIDSPPLHELIRQKIVEFEQLAIKIPKEIHADQPLAEELPADEPLAEEPWQRRELVAEEQAWQALVETGALTTRWHDQHSVEKISERQALELDELLAQLDKAVVNYGQAAQTVVDRGLAMPKRDHYLERMRTPHELALNQAATNFARPIEHDQVRDRELDDTTKVDDPDGPPAAPVETPEKDALPTRQQMQDQAAKLKRDNVLLERKRFREAQAAKEAQAKAKQLEKDKADQVAKAEAPTGKPVTAEQTDYQIADQEARLQSGRSPEGKEQQTGQIKDAMDTQKKRMKHGARRDRGSYESNRKERKPRDRDKTDDKSPKLPDGKPRDRGGGMER